MKKISKNVFYQTLYQIVITITPLITAPYLARVLGAEQQGIFSFRLSIVSYFVLFSVLGMETLGAKVISSKVKSEEERDKAFMKLAFVQSIISSFFSFLYIAYCIVFVKNILISWILVIQIIAYIFDFTWFFHGIQNFKIPSIINLLTRVANVVFILVFVNAKNDLNIYALIMSLTTFFSFTVQTLFVIKRVNFKNFALPNKTEFFLILKKSLILFLPIAAQTIYHVMDKTMLGSMSTFEQTGYYYNVDKLISIPVSVLAGVSTVMLPRVSELISKGESDEAIREIKKSFFILSWLSVGLCFGTISISDLLVPIFFGEEFLPCIFLTRLLSAIIVIKSMSIIIKTQYLIPFDKTKIFTISVAVGALVNVVVNFILIKNMGATGAIIGTICAETLSLMIQIVYFFKKEKNIIILLDLFMYIILGAIMAISLYFIPAISSKDYVNMIIKIIIGFAIYSFASAIYILLFRRQTFYETIGRASRRNNIDNNKTSD